MRRNLERVTRLGTDLKDMANLEAGHVAIVPSDVDLVAAAAECARAYAPEAAQRDVGLAVEAPQPVRVLADEGRVAQVLDNLVANALKFTPAGGNVAIRIHAAQGRGAVDVCDSGRGLAASEMARLFQAFSQVHAPGEVKERGTGLGLFICKGLLERQGGGIEAESPGLHQGSTFRFWLPQASRDDGTPPAGVPMLHAPTLPLTLHGTPPRDAGVLSTGPPMPP
jgi:signal transduction histidine kinase